MEKKDQKINQIKNHSNINKHNVFPQGKESATQSGLLEVAVISPLKYWW